VRTDPAEILEAAADLYESEKIDWCKCNFFNSGETVANGRIISACAWGAIVLAATGHEGLAWKYILPGGVGGETVDAINNTVSIVNSRLDKKDLVRLPYYNDKIVNSKQEIIDLFKETAKDLRNQK
jgi:hypothetical protein